MRRLVMAMVVVVAGCASPPTDLFTLAAVPGPAVTSSTHSVELRRIGLAGYLDRPGIVRSNAQYRLQVSDLDRWGEPLGGMVARVFTEAGAISTQPDVVLELDIQRFDADATGDVVLLAQAAVRHDAGNRPATARIWRLSQHLPSDSTRDLVATMSAVLGQLADRVTEVLR